MTPGPIPNSAWVAGSLLVALSALVKYTTGLVGLFFWVAWAARLPSWRARVAWLGGTAVLLAIVSAALFWPWWEWPRVLAPVLNAAGGSLYTNSLPDLLALTVADHVLDPAGLNRVAAHETARFWMKVLTRVAFLVYLGWEIRRLWALARRSDSRQVLLAVVRAATRAFLVLLLVVLTWVLTWYFTWPLALAALLGWRSSLARVVVGYSLTSLPVFYVHHYWNWAMPGALLLLYALPPLLVPLADWWRRRGRPDHGQAGAHAAARPVPSKNGRAHRLA